jgi:hypothetical protein
MALLGYPRGHRIIPGDSVLHGSTRRLMSVGPVQWPGQSGKELVFGPGSSAS